MDIVVPIFGIALCLMWCLFIVDLLVDMYKTLKTLKKKNTNNNMIQKYRKKPVVIEAIQYLGLENKREIQEFVGDNITMYIDEINSAFTLIIHTLEGDMGVSLNDYIIKGVNGEFYLCKPDIFEKTYEKVD